MYKFESKVLFGGSKYSRLKIERIDGNRMSQNELLPALQVIKNTVKPDQTLRLFLKDEDEGGRLYTKYTSAFRTLANIQREGDVPMLAQYDIEEHEPVNVEFELGDDNTFMFLIVVAKKRTRRQGGVSGMLNDCLVDIIAEAGFNVKPCNLKRKIGLKRKDMIPVSKIPLIENIIKCRITCSPHYFGNEMYNKVINVRLDDDHYTRIGSTEIKENGVLGYAALKPEYFSRRLVVYRHNSKAKQTEYYTGKNKYTTSSDRFFKFKVEKALKYAFWSCKGWNLKEQHAKWMAQARIVKEQTGQNLFAYKSIADFSLRLLQSELIYDLEIGDSAHDKMYVECVSGALQGYVNGFYTDMIDFDVRKMYSSFLANRELPITQGTFISPNEASDLLDKEFVPMGFYAVKAIDDLNPKLYRYVESEMYDWLTITQWNKTGVKYTKLNKPSIIWKAHERAKHVGLQFINTYLNNEFKPFVQPAWGKLMEKMTRTINVHNEFNDSTLEIVDVVDIIDDARVLVEVKNHSLPTYRTCPYIGLVMIALGRDMLRKALTCVDCVYWHTDGLIMKASDLPKVQHLIGDKIGDFRVKKKAGNVKIHNGKYEWS